MNEWFYLYIFTQLLIIEFLSLFLFLLSIHLWISDLILSLLKKHPPLYPFLFITILLFINSETLLFLTYLWIIFNYLWISKHNILRVKLFYKEIRHRFTFSNFRKWYLYSFINISCILSSIFRPYFFW